MAGCVACHKPLIFYVEPDEQDEEDDAMEGTADANTGSYVDDDVQLQCGCHFHWQCLLDSYTMTECPHCGRNLTSTNPQGEEELLCNLKNEAGSLGWMDMLSLLAEESYLKAYPEERGCRAFLILCEQNDLEAIVALVDSDAHDHGGEEEEEGEGMMGDDVSSPGTGNRLDMLRYQDGMGSMGSGLHVAIQNQKPEVAWLLLLLASTLGMNQFPAAVLQGAQDLRIGREDQSGKVDIRSLKDSQGMTAEQHAAGIGGIWTEWIHKGWLKPPPAT